MDTKKYISLSRLSNFLDNLKNTFATLGHTHNISEIKDYKVDSALSDTSTNPVQNKVIDAEFDAVSEAMSALESSVDSKADAAHTHDDVYYTETEIDEKIAVLDDRIVAEDVGELTTELPDMFGGRTADEYALKTDLENVSGLPAGAKPNQYIVTDGEGNAKWEDKLFGIEKTEKEVLPETVVPSSLEVTGLPDGVYAYALPFVIESSKKYIVVYNEVEYPVSAKNKELDGSEIVFAGNLGLVGFGDDTGEPFVIGNTVEGHNSLMYALDEFNLKLAVYEITETVHPIDKKYLRGNTIFFVQSSTQGQGDAFLYRTEDGANNYDVAQRVTKSELEAAFFAGAISVKDISIEWYFMPVYVRFDLSWGQMKINNSFVCYTAEIANVVPQ